MIHHYANFTIDSRQDYIENKFKFGASFNLKKMSAFTAPGNQNMPNDIVNIHKFEPQYKYILVRLC